MPNTVLVPIGGNDGGPQGFTLVDEADVAVATRPGWYLESRHGRTRVLRLERKRGIYLSRQLLGLEPGDPRQVDHKNRNTLDNRRSNLRIATPGQNSQNRGVRSDSRSGVRGVGWFAPTRKWRAHACVDGKRRTLGYFDTIEEAAAVVSAWRREHMPFSEMDR